MELSHNTTEKILAAIETKQVTPRPKWYFIVRNTVLWIPGIATTFFGAYTVSGILYGILHIHLENRLYSDHPSQVAFSVAIPLLWIVSFSIFSLVTITLLRKTNTGYRHTAVQLLSISVACSILIGILFYTFTASALDGPGTFYRYPTQHQQDQMWSNPESGRISGVITDVNDSSLTMNDFGGVVWNVDTATLSAEERALLQRGNAIRIVGLVTNEHAFTACRVLPWELFPIRPASGQQFTVHKDAVSCQTILMHFNQ